MAKIKISQIDSLPPDYSDTSVSKEKSVARWLLSWIQNAIASGCASYGDFLPHKHQLAKYLGVSAGTLQNAVRYLQDMGYLESRQSVGTMLKNPQMQDKFFEKPFSKKDRAVVLIKKYVLDNKIKIGAKLPSVKELSKLTSLGENTVRLALDSLVCENFLCVSNSFPNKAHWFYKTEFNQNDLQIHDNSLVDIIAKKMSDYIVNNYQIGEKILSNDKFAAIFNVSIRTVNEAAKKLNKQKIILSRRGQYGTIFINNPKNIKTHMQREEKSLFMSKSQKEVLEKNYLYSWEKALDALEKYIIKNCKIGDKIPPMRDLADILNVSTNTIKHAISVLCEEGYLIAQRGKYGGVFILEMPQENSGAFTWLALNPNVVKIKKD